MRYKIERRVNYSGPGDLWKFEAGQIIEADVDAPAWVIEILVAQGYAAPTKSKPSAKGDKQES